MKYILVHNIKVDGYNDSLSQVQYFDRQPQLKDAIIDILGSDYRVFEVKELGVTIDIEFT